MSAQMKLFIDRLYALNFKKFPSGKKLVLLTTYGNKDEKTSGSINVEKTFKYISNFLKMDFILSLDKSSEVSKEKWKKILKETYLMGKKIDI